MILFELNIFNLIFHKLIINLLIGTKQLVVVSEVLEFHVQDRKQIGKFECLAENGFGKAILKQIEIKLVGKTICC